MTIELNVVWTCRWSVHLPINQADTHRGFYPYIWWAQFAPDEK